ncbi:hypothetical protein NFI96_019148 [Prochilodus magdalenae]|nr:hypothetical protein NFI96_019148 [Prochilodus magdalenae]
MCRSAGWGPQGHLQHLAETGCQTTVPKDCHNHTSAQKPTSPPSMITARQHSPYHEEVSRETSVCVGGDNISSVISLSTGSPQGYVLGTLLFTLMTPTNHIVKFTDDTTVLGPERKALQRVVKTAQHMTASTLPPIQDIYDKRRLRKAAHISSDPTHPSHPLFQPLPSGKRYRNIRARTTRFRNSFYPRAVKLVTIAAPEHDYTTKTATDL